MSKYFKQNNAESTRHLYNKSRVYTGEMKDAKYENIKNFRRAEKYLYGREANTTEIEKRKKDVTDIKQKIKDLQETKIAKKK